MINLIYSQSGTFSSPPLANLHIRRVDFHMATGSREQHSAQSTNAPGQDRLAYLSSLFCPRGRDAKLGFQMLHLLQLRNRQAGPCSHYIKLVGLNLQYERLSNNLGCGPLVCQCSYTFWLIMWQHNKPDSEANAEVWPSPRWVLTFLSSLEHGFFGTACLCTSYNFHR